MLLSVEDADEDDDEAQDMDLEEEGEQSPDTFHWKSMGYCLYSL